MRGGVHDTPTSRIYSIPTEMSDDDDGESVFVFSDEDCCGNDGVSDSCKSRIDDDVNDVEVDGLVGWLLSEGEDDERAILI